MMKTRAFPQTYPAIGALAAVALLLVALMGLTAGCSSPGPSHEPEAGQEATFPEGFPEAPEWYRASPEHMQALYVAAAHHAHELQHIPCYCGCGDFHASNFDCYFYRDETGEVAAFDWHAAGCQICLDITRDVVIGLEEGKSLARIRQEIDQAYQAMGLEPTPTPMPPADP